MTDRKHQSMTDRTCPCCGNKIDTDMLITPMDLKPDHIKRREADEAARRKLEKEFEEYRKKQPPSKVLVWLQDQKQAPSDFDQIASNVFWDILA